MKKHTKHLNARDVRQLILSAKATRENAFMINSEHAVGASVLCEDGSVFGGCNVQHVISGLGVCAERAAIDHAVAHGHYSFRAVCVVDGGFLPPCGACLQYMQLFSQVNGVDFALICANTAGRYRTYRLSSLLPHGFKTKKRLSIVRSYAKRKAQRSQ